MIRLYRPIEKIPSIFKLTPRSVEGNSFDLITQGFGENLAPFYAQLGLLGHNGIDLIAPNGTEVYAAHSGKITKTYDVNNSSKTIGYGVWITHSEDWQTVYFHLQDVLVKVGDEVKAGEMIGHADNTGLYTTGDHLHFGLYPANPDKSNGYDGAISPIKYFSIEEITGIINQNKNMRYVITGKEQYLLDDNLKIALNIGDEFELAELVKWGLKGSPEVIANIDGYAIYPLIRKSRLRDLFGL